MFYIDYRLRGELKQPPNNQILVMIPMRRQPPADNRRQLTSPALRRELGRPCEPH